VSLVLYFEQREPIQVQKQREKGRRHKGIKQRIAIVVAGGIADSLQNIQASSAGTAIPKYDAFSHKILYKYT
jgi:hypothetical protein